MQQASPAHTTPVSHECIIRNIRRGQSWLQLLASADQVALAVTPSYRDTMGEQRTVVH